MADDLRLFKSLATMNRKAPLPALRVQKLTWEKAAALAREWNLKQFARRLDDFAALPSAVVKLHDDDDDCERECDRVR